MSSHARASPPRAEAQTRTPTSTPGSINHGGKMLLPLLTLTTSTRRPAVDFVIP